MTISANPNHNVVLVESIEMGDQIEFFNEPDVIWRVEEVLPGTPSAQAVGLLVQNITDGKVTGDAEWRYLKPESIVFQLRENIAVELKTEDDEGEKSNPEEEDWEEYEDPAKDPYAGDNLDYNAFSTNHGVFVELATVVEYLQEAFEQAQRMEEVGVDNPFEIVFGFVITDLVSAQRRIMAEDQDV